MYIKNLCGATLIAFLLATAAIVVQAKETSPSAKVHHGGQSNGTPPGPLSKSALGFDNLTSRAYPYEIRWPTITPLRISQDGSYVAYAVRNQRLGRTKYILQATQSTWKTELENISDPQFTSDGREALFLEAKRLCRVTLGESASECIPNVSSFRLWQYHGEDWLAYLAADSDRTLFVRKLTAARADSFTSVKTFSFSNDGSMLAILRGPVISRDSSCELIDIFHLASGKRTTIWQGEQADKILISRDGLRVAFISTEKRADNPVKLVWSYRQGEQYATVVIDDRSPELAKGRGLAGLDRFNIRGDRLFITLKTSPLPLADQKSVQVDVWNYKDSKLQSEQLYQLGRAIPPFFNDSNPESMGSGRYRGVLDLQSHHILRLQGDDEQIGSLAGDDYVVVTKNHGDFHESYWNAAAQSSYYLESTISGLRTSIGKRPIDITADEKYLILTDFDYHNFFVYEIATGTARRIDISIPETDKVNGFLQASAPSLVPAARIKDSSTVLMYDKYDIWEIDATGSRPPINLTNGYGRRHQIVFRLASGEREVANNTSLLLAAFNKRTKDNGFYRKVLGEAGDPSLLTMGPYLYSWQLDYPGLNQEFAPIKAKNANVYVLRRQSAEQSPNYFWTSDWHNFHPISDVYPEKSYNWLTSQLVTWKCLDGTTIQGLVYKPEDFDPHKKYPVIINFYETMSDRLHEYQPPELSSGAINIPWFVSHGYVVFTPDIHYTVGAPGESAYNAVVSGAEFISKLPWVDKKKIGIAGHSFGGFEVNYLISHTNIFAAALSSSGVSDLVSFYLSAMLLEGYELQTFTERGQNRMGATLWQRPNAYIANSAVFRADKVSTPLLMMNTNRDVIVSFLQQGVSWFLALRRAGKRVWMLEYDDEDHNLSKDQNTLDYTKRITQFFDYYLKDAPPPVWMTRGVPARSKGADTGLELDTSGAKP